MKAAGIRYEKRRPPSGGRRRRPRGLVAKARSRVFSIDGCVNDAVGRRTSMSRSGSAYTTSDTISYTYNDRSELTGAQSNVDTAYLNNPTPLPHFQPPKDIIGWYRDKDDSKGLSDYVREAKEAAQKAAINLKKCPCNCDSVSIKVIRVDKEFPWFLFDPSYEEQIDIGRTN